MRLKRQCDRTACNAGAVATLTFVQSEGTAVVGPLATHAEPHTYDLCADHAARLTVPRGWSVVRLAMQEQEPQPSDDDLLALADAVREAGRVTPSGDTAATRRPGPAAHPLPGAQPGPGRPALRLV